MAFQKFSKNNLGQQLNIFREIEKPLLSVNQTVIKCLICNKNICANHASGLGDNGWKTLKKLAKTWDSVVLSIDYQHYKYTQFYKLIGDRKRAFCKQNHSRNCHPAFGRQSVMNKLKKDNDADQHSIEATGASTLLPWDASLMSSISSTSRNHSSTGNTKQFEKNCFAYNKIRLCDFNHFSEA